MQKMVVLEIYQDEVTFQPPKDGLSHLGVKLRPRPPHRVNSVRKLAIIVEKTKGLNSLW